MELSNDTTKTFITILSDGKFHKVVPEGTEGAIKREVKDKKTGQVTSIKNELIFSTAKGVITDVFFKDGEYGKNINIEFDNEAILSIGVKNSFAEYFMRRFKNIKPGVEVTLRPFSFENDKGKNVRGLKVIQDGVTLSNYYYDEEAKKSINGLPLPKDGGKDFDSDDWTSYYTQVRKFLINDIEKSFTRSPISDVSKAEDVEDEEFDESKIPF